jgi:hypothetical protein
MIQQNFIARAVAAVFGRETRPLADRVRIPIESFAKDVTLWIALLTEAMLRTRRGCRTPASGRTPPPGAAHWRGERRGDKPGTTKLSRRLAQIRSISR